MSIEFLTSRDMPEDVGAIGVGVCSDDLDSASEHVDLAFLAERGFNAQPGEVLAAPGGDGGATVIAVGMGPAADVDLDKLREAGAAFARATAKNHKVATTLLDVVPDGIDRAKATQAIVEGIGLGSYRFTAHKSKPEVGGLDTVTIVGTGGKKLATGAERGAAIVEAVCFARDLVNEPAGSLPPRAMADRAIQMAERVGLRYSVLDEVDIEAAGLGGVMAVSAGSTEPARVVELTYEPPKARGTLYLVGKGITFDSGGLSLKPPEGMMTMKTDMGGAAAVIGAMSALPALGVKCKVVAIVPMSENMVSGTSIKPGDVFTARNGKTVEVLNTDAEGRLILADGLSLAVEAEPDAIVDVATLTGAQVVALGGSIAGLMGNHDDWIDQIRDAADRAGEPVWPMPLPDKYWKMMESEVADMKNVATTPGVAGSGRAGGMLTAGLFLKQFAGDGPWAHLDIAGPARAGADDGIVTKGGTGFAVRTLIELAAGFRKPKKG